MPGIQQLALTGVECPSVSEVRRATFNLSFNFFVLIIPAQVLVYIETKIFGFGNPTYFFLVDFNFIKFIQVIVLS